MKAIEYGADPFKYILVKYLSKISRRLAYGPLSLAKIVNRPEPDLIGEEWVKVKVLMSGICGSDIAALEAKESIYLEPYISKKFILGHENVGIVVKKGSKVKNVKVGDRVAVQPFLSCKQRGIKNECRYCMAGDYSLCENVNEGKLSRGISIGLNEDTGGGWSEVFLAHRSNLFKLPKEISNEEGVLLDSYACTLHAVMRNIPKKRDIVMVYGCGTVGLDTIAAIRALSLKNKIISLCTRNFQKTMALRLGADIVINPREKNLFEKIAKITRARIYRPTIGKPALEGGVDIVYECVATSDTINNSLRFLRAQGRLVLIATAGVVENIDMAPVWFRELRILGSCEQNTERYKNTIKATYQIAIEHMKSKKADIKGMVNYKFPIREFKKAIRTAIDKNSGSIKVALYNEKA